MNNKGFAITGILYSVLVLFLLVILSMIGILNEKRERLEKLAETINNTDSTIDSVVESDEDNCQWSGCFCINSAENSILKYSDKEECKEVTISDTINNVNIKNIGDSAFKGLGITKLELSDGIENIGPSAFEKNQIKELVIPVTVKVIGDKAFSDNSLTSVTIKGKSAIGDFENFGSDVLGWAEGYSDADIDFIK